MKRAQEKGLFQYSLYNLADWTVRKTRRVDDRPYGGFPGTIIMVEPLYNCIQSIQETLGYSVPILYFTPRGKRMKQAYIEKFSRKSDEYILICSHYEWVDERIFSIFPEIQSISIWDYVLSSWELASVVWIDSVVRLLPGVINADSLEEESFSKKLNRKKEYPQYTRPSNFLWYEVPGELLSWDKKIIENWKKKYY